jgi:hypothetical protein
MEEMNNKRSFTAIQTNCPVKNDLDHTIKLGKEFSNYIYRLRRRMVACNKCVNRQDCAIIENFHNDVSAIITALNEEWGMVN